MERTGEKPSRTVRKVLNQLVEQSRSYGLYPTWNTTGEGIPEHDALLQNVEATIRRSERVRISNRLSREKHS